MFSPSVLTIVCVLVVFVVKRYGDLAKAAKRMKNVPGYTTFLDQSSQLGFLLENGGSFVFSRHRLFVEKYAPYAKAGWDIIPAYSVFPKLTTSIFVSDSKTINVNPPVLNCAFLIVGQEICAARITFPKPIEQFSALTMLGRNIIASEGEEWRKFRKISAPAFSERTNQLVWNEATRAFMDLLDNAWYGKDSITVEHCLSLTIPLALQVIGMVGFGMKMTSSEEKDPPSGHQLTFAETLKIVSEDVFLKVVVGNWCPNVTKRIHSVNLAFEELKLYLKEILHSRHSLSNEGGYDVFSSLIAANEDETNPLGDAELIGNIFIFVIAGHETTAHTLCYVFALLALYPDEQEKVYEEAKSICGADLLSQYQDMNRYTRTMAVLNETLRLFPAIAGIVKESGTDTTLSTTNADGETLTIPLPKKTPIVLHVTAMHHNPRYWKDPDEFRPERFLGDWPKDAFLPFSGGARSCLGRKFFETEAIAFIVLLVLRYRIMVAEEAAFVGESFEERKKRVLDTRSGLTLTPKRVPLTFSRR